MNDNLKCDACGKFVSHEDLEKGNARHALVTPDSHYSKEEYETTCRGCKHKEVALDLEKKIKEKKEAIRQLEEDVLELEDKLGPSIWEKHK